MGLTKQYLRYSSSSPAFGIIASSNSQVRFVKGSTKYLAVGACENVIIWNTKTGEKVRILENSSSSTGGGKSQVTALSVNDANNIAVGYANGSITIFDCISGEIKVTFNGHKSAVSCLCFDRTGMKLASGGKDSEIVIWDVVNESGLFRLRGHKNLITQCQFMKDHANILVTSSKDTYIKFWDLNTQHCFKTVLAHRNEVWSFVLVKKDTLLITGSSELKAWEIDFKNSSTEENVQKEDSVIPRVYSSQVIKRNDDCEGDEGNDDETDNANDDDDDTLLDVKLIGSILRKSVNRLQYLGLSENEELLLCHGLDNFVEPFKIRSDDEIRTLLTKRARKEKRKFKRKENDTFADNDLQLTKSLSDEIDRLELFKTSSKVKYCDISTDINSEMKIACLLNSNSIEMFTLNMKAVTIDKAEKIEHDGHRSDIRTVAFSFDNYYILSASADSLKIWNRSTQKCISTIKENFEYALCSTFTGSSRICITGTKTGKLQIFDIGSSTILETIEATEDSLPVWSICLYPDHRGLVSGGEDKFVRFWDFEFMNNNEGKDNEEELDNDDETNQSNRKMKRRGYSGAKRLTLTQKRVLDIQEGILVVKISPNSKFLAVSLLDSTVKLFFFDTLKFYVSLYGHKFPVLCMDISSDSALIATASSDKNIKIWGMDFGDCHKSIFAHDDSIMALQFVAKTHYFFTASKDKTIKEWDGDKYEKIITLTGHQNEIWCLTISPNGNYLVSGSHDKTLRLWEKTEEPLVLEEEKELEREEEYESNLLNAGDEEPVIAGENNKETGLAARMTTESLKSTERLIEAIDIFKVTVRETKIHEQQVKIAQREEKKPPVAPPINPLMIAYRTNCPYRYMLEVIRKVKYSELEEALLYLPFNYTIDFLFILTHFLERDWETELVIRCVTFLTRIHFGQILSSSNLTPMIDKLRKLMVLRVNQLRDIVGTNLAALQFMAKCIEDREEVSLFTDAFNRLKENKNKKKRNKKVNKSVPILQVT